MSCQPRCSHSSRLPKPVDQVAPGAAERLGLRGGIGERHLLLPLPSLRSPRPNLSRRPKRRNRIHSRSPAGSRRVTRKNQPNRSHSCGSSLRRPGCDMQIAAVAVGEEPLGLVVGVLGVHPAAEDRLELVATLRVQVHRVQAGAERQPGAHQPAVQLDLVAADEQPKVRHANGFQRRRAEQRAVEQRRDAGQQVAAEPSLRSSLTRRRHTSPRRSGNASRSRVGQDRTPSATPRPARVSRRRPAAWPARRVRGPAVVVGQPDPVGAQRQGVQHAERETACAAEVSARAEVGRRNRLTGNQFAHARVVVVVDDDQVVRARGSGRQRVQRLGQFVGAAVGDDDGAHRVSHRHSRSRRSLGDHSPQRSSAPVALLTLRRSSPVSSSTSRTCRAASSPS